MRTAVIVQARMGSKRFPGKVLADLCGKPVLWHVLTKAHKIDADYYYLAAPLKDADYLKPVAYDCGFTWFGYGGDENDVLGRYYSAAESIGLRDKDTIVRITGDCPLIDVMTSNGVKWEVMNGSRSYASNALPREVSKGLDTEAFSFWLLELAHRTATSPQDREHVTPWMQRRDDLPRLAVDTPDDLERVRAIMEQRAAA